jgi:hypothetical protein
MPGWWVSCGHTHVRITCCSQGVWIAGVARFRKLIHPIFNQPLDSSAPFANELHSFMHDIAELWDIPQQLRCAQHSRPMVAPPCFRIRLIWAGQPRTTFAGERISDKKAQMAKTKNSYRTPTTRRMAQIGEGG